MTPKEQILGDLMGLHLLATAADSDGRRSCLLCMHFRLRDHATLIVCDRARTVYLTSELPQEEGSKQFKRMLTNCRGRAKLCPWYEVDE